MSTPLHVICPKCQTKLQVQCPDADQASARCQCGHTFSFKVPASARSTAPTSGPVSNGSAFAGPAATDDLFAGLPSSPPVGRTNASAGRPNTSVGLSSAPPPAAFHASGRAAPKKKTAARTGPGARPAKPRWLIPVVVSTLVMGIMGVGAAAWMMSSQGSILPPSIGSVFESAGSIWADANASDSDTAAWVDEYLANPAAMKDNEAIARLRSESKHLVARAALLSPLSEAKAKRLAASTGGEPIGPLTEADHDAIHDKLYERGNNQRSFLLSVVGTIFKQNDFAREFLYYGHVELPDSSVEGEQVMIEQIRLLRQFNRLAAEIAVAEHGKVGEMMSQEDFKTRMDDLYGPIFDDTEAIAEQLRELAVRQYQVPKDQVGDRKKYNEILYYVNQGRAQILPNDLALIQSGASIVGYIRDMRLAAAEIESAARGIKPDRLAKADAEMEQADAEKRRREQERLDKIAADEAARKKAQQAQMESSEPNSNTLAENQVPKSDRPSGPGDAFGGMTRPPMGRGGPPFGSGRFGNGQPPMAAEGPADNESSYDVTPPGTMGARPGGFGGRPGGVGPGNAPGPRFGPGNRPSPPDIDTTTGVTIKMSNAGAIRSGPHTQKFSRTLKCPVHWSARNGEVTIKLGYTGSLDDVVKLIDFGTVTSTDPDKRTITVTPNP